MIKFITGSTRSKKTAYCYDEIIEALGKDEFTRLIVLVPDQANLQVENDLANRLAPGLLRVEVMSFQRFARDVLKEVGGLQTPLIDDLERIMILKKLLEAHKSQLQYFKKTANNEGFIDEVNRLITVFEQNHIDEEVLTSLIAAPSVGEVFKCKLQDVAHIQKWFETYIGERFVTVEKTMERLAHSIHKSKRLQGVKLWVDGFYGFTMTQMEILGALMEKVDDFTITLPMDKPYTKDEYIFPNNPYYDSIKTYQKLLGMVESRHLERYLVPTIWCEHAEPECSPLDYIRDCFLKPFVKPYGKAQDAVILNAIGTKEEEIEKTARRIRALIRDQGYRYHDIGILVGDLGSYQSSIVSIFSEYDIPVFIDAKRKIHTNSLVAFILSALEVLTSRWSYKSVMTLLRLEMMTIPREAVDVLDNYILACGIQSEKKWYEEWIYETSIADLEVLNSYRAQIVAYIDTLKVTLQNVKSEKGHLTIRDLTMALYKFLETCHVKETIEERIEIYEALGEGMLLQEHLGIWGQVMEMLERLVDILGDERMNLQAYRNLLQTSFAYIKMGIVPPSLDQVVVGTVDRSRLPHIKAVFVLGVNEGVIPSQGSSMALFSEMDKLTLQLITEGKEDATAKLTDVLIHKPLYEGQFLVYTALTRAKSQLFVSTLKRDEAGKSMRPSLVYYKLSKMFGVTEDALEDLEQVTSPQATMSYVGTMLRKYISGDELKDEEVWKDTLTWYLKQPEWSHKVKQLIKDFGFSPQQHYLTAENAARLYPNGLETNISQLESYRHCPCCYFIKYGIKASERKLFRWNEADLGKLFHATLEQYPRELYKLNATWTTVSEVDRLACVSRAVQYSVQKTVQESQINGRMRYVVSKVTQMSQRAIHALTYQLKQGDFTPYAYEVNFGFEGLPAIEIVLEDGRSICLKGQIDRVDLYVENEDNHFIKIIDYKSGQKDFNLLEVYHALQLQLLLYLDAYLRLNEANKPAGMFYFHIDSRHIKYKLGMSQEDLKDQQLQQYKLSGLVLDDPEVVKHLESTMAGEIVPAKLKKDGSFTATSSVATQEQFETLRTFMVTQIKRIGTEMLNGRISAKPYKFKSQEGCTHCKYATICQFDSACEVHEYDKLESIPTKELWSTIADDVKKYEKGGGLWDGQ